MSLNIIHTRKGTVRLIEPGIIKVTLKGNIEWTLEDAIETHKANLKLSNNGKYCVYFYGDKFFIPTKEAQKFAVSEAVLKHRIAAALVPKNYSMLLFAKLFTQVFKSKSPTVIFKTENEALKWIREQLQKATETDLS